MNTIYAEYNMYHNSIDIYTSAGYMLRYLSPCTAHEKFIQYPFLFHQ